MIDKVHEHIIDELRTNSKFDTIFIIIAVGFNLLTLAINASIADTELNKIITMIFFSILTIVISLVSEIGLIKGRQMRLRLLDGLMSMYEDNNVVKYVDKEIFNQYKLRYNLFIITILLTGVVSIAVPFININ